MSTDKGITKVLLGFDLFNQKNTSLVHSIKNVGLENLIILSNDPKVDDFLEGKVSRIAAPVYDGDIVTKYFQFAAQLPETTDTLVLLLPHFPFRTTQTVKEAISAFSETDPSFLMAIASSGLDAEVIYITSKEHLEKQSQFFGDEQNAYPFMVDDVVGFKAFNPDHYNQALAQGVEETGYSTNKQRELAARYRDNVRDYDQEFLDDKEITDPVVLRSSRDAPERMNKLVAIPKGQRILDIGCSSGNVAIRYARVASEDSKILAVDIDDDLIATANGYLRRESPKVKEKLHFINKPIEEIDEKPESFNTITATEFFEHVLHSQHHQLMQQSLRLLKPDGNMVVSVPNRFPTELYVVQKRYRWDWFNHYTHFTQRSLEHFMGKYFKEVRFHPVYDEPANQGIFLIAEGVGKR